MNGCREHRITDIHLHTYMLQTYIHTETPPLIVKLLFDILHSDYTLGVPQTPLLLHILCEKTFRKDFASTNPGYKKNQPLPSPC